MDLLAARARRCASLCTFFISLGLSSLGLASLGCETPAPFVPLGDVGPRRDAPRDVPGAPIDGSVDDGGTLDAGPPSSGFSADDVLLFGTVMGGAGGAVCEAAVARVGMVRDATAALDCRDTLLTLTVAGEIAYVSGVDHDVHTFTPDAWSGGAWPMDPLADDRVLTLTPECFPDWIQAEPDGGLVLGCSCDEPASCEIRRETGDAYDVPDDAVLAWPGYGELVLFAPPETVPGRDVPVELWDGTNRLEVGRAGLDQIFGRNNLYVRPRADGFRYVDIDLVDGNRRYSLHHIAADGSVTSLGDYPPTPTNLEPEDACVIAEDDSFLCIAMRLTEDFTKVVLRYRLDGTTEIVHDGRDSRVHIENLSVLVTAP